MFCSPDSLLTRVDSSSEDYELYFELVQLLRQMLIWEGKYRPTADQALHSTFFKVGNPNPPLDKPYSCDSPVIFSQSFPPSHVERSCESLSVCLQQENPPVKNLQRSPVVVPSSYGPTHMMKSWSQKGEEPSKESTHHHSSLSMDSSHSASSVEVYFSHFRKHRRVMTTPMLRKESFQIVSSPYISSNASGIITPSATTSPAKTDVSRSLFVSNKSPSFSSPFSLPLRSTLSEDDYRTPTPSALSLLREGGLPQPPQFKETSSSMHQSILRISHPPSFDEVSQNRSDSEPQGVMSPILTPLSSLYSDRASFQVTKYPVSKQTLY